MTPAHRRWPTSTRTDPSLSAASGCVRSFGVAPRAADFAAAKLILEANVLNANRPTRGRAARGAFWATMGTGVLAMIIFVFICFINHLFRYNGNDFSITLRQVGSHQFCNLAQHFNIFGS